MRDLPKMSDLVGMFSKNPVDLHGREKITVVYGSDWEGIYVDGKLASESHSHSAAQALEAVGFSVETATADEDWLSDRGSLPESLSECQLGASDE